MWIDKNYLNSSKSTFIFLAETKILFDNMFQIFLDHFIQMGYKSGFKALFKIFDIINWPKRG
jgi:hypothetical protein